MSDEKVDKVHADLTHPSVGGKKGWPLGPIESGERN